MNNLQNTVTELTEMDDDNQMGYGLTSDIGMLKRRALEALNGNDSVPRLRNETQCYIWYLEPCSY